MQRGSDYLVDSIIIKPQYGSGTDVDVYNIMVEMHLYEDIYKPFLHGTLMLSDSSGLIEQTPISGEEFLLIKLETPGAEQVVEHEFQIYKVSGRASTGNVQQAYVLHFMSKEAFKNGTTPISIGFEKQLISDQVKKIYNENLKIDKDIDVETTKTPRTMSFSQWSPVRIINETRKTAQSSKYGEGADYQFWEGLDGFHFRTVQSLLDEIEPKVDSKQREKLTWTGQNICGADDPAANNQAIRNYNIIDQGDNLKRVVNGATASTQIAFDPIQGSVVVTDKTIEEVHRAVQTMEANLPMGSKFAQVYQNAGALNHAVRNLLFTDASEEAPSGVERFAQTQRMQSNFLNGMKIDLELNGNTGRKIGDVVDLNLPATVGVDQGLLNDSQISGNALIIAINHGWTQDAYLQNVRVVKDSSREEIDSLVP